MPTSTYVVIDSSIRLFIANDICFFNVIILSNYMIKNDIFIHACESMYNNFCDFQWYIRCIISLRYIRSPTIYMQHYLLNL